MKYSDQTTKHLNVKPAVSETSSPALNYWINDFNFIIIIYLENIEKVDLDLDYS